MNKKKVKPIFYCYMYLFIFCAILLFTPLLFIINYIPSVYFRLMLGFGFFALLLWYSFLLLYINKRFKPTGVER
jgi:hypothetical protein